MDKVEKRIASDVKKLGFHIIGVLGQPRFAYTIGLETTFDHPEVILFGLNDDLKFMFWMLNQVGERVKKGERFEHGAKKRDLLPGYVCPFARFPKVAYEDHVGRAIDFHAKRKGGFRVVQMIWPDPKKRFPWDPKVMPPILARQPVFLRPDEGPRDPKWPFRDTQSKLVFTTRQVVTGKEPIRYIEHDDDGDWIFACDTTKDEEDLVVTSLGWVLDRDPSVAAAAKLKGGKVLRRKSQRSAWSLRVS
jgi:hypothetical protein